MKKNVLYNYITNILLDRIISKKLCNTREPIYFVASQKDTNKYLNKVFTDYITTKVKNRIDLKLEIKSSSRHKCLQIVDFLSWGIFQKYEHNDESYYEMVKNSLLKIICYLNKKYRKPYELFTRNVQNPIRKDLLLLLII